MKSYFTALIYILVAYALGFALSPTLSFLTWDNYEMFLPSTFAAHSLWLKGIWPVWNTHQHLGEPTMALAQYAVFYLPYFVFTALIQTLKLPLASFVYMNLTVHMLILSFGVWNLLRHLKIQPHLQLAGAIASAGLGPVLTTTPVWMHTLTVVSWIPIAFWLTLKPYELSIKEKFFSLIAFSQIFLTGHLQNSLYALLMIFSVSLVFQLMVLQKRKLKHTWLLIGLSIFSIGSSAAAWLPTVVLMRSMDKRKALPLADFLSGSIPPSTTLKGLFSPFGTASISLFSDFTVTSYFGPLVALALVMTLLALSKKTLKKSELISLAIACASVSLVYFIFAWGEFTPIYGWTYKIPIWGGLKYTTRFLFPIGIPVLIGTLCVLNHKHSIEYAPQITAALCAIYVILSLNQTDHLGWYVGLLATALVTYGYFQKTILLYIGSALAITAVLCAVGVHQHRIYPQPLESVSEMKLPTKDRLFTANMKRQTAEPEEGPVERGLFQFATISNYLGNEYYSATGSKTALQPVHYLSLLPSNNYGMLRPNESMIFIKSAVRAALNIKYVSVPKEEAGEFLGYIGQENIEGAIEHGKAVIFGFKSVLGKAFLASEIDIYEREKFAKTLLADKADSRSVFVNDLEAPETFIPGQVVKAEFEEDGSARIEVFATSKQFLVYSETFDTQFRALVDGKEAQIQRANIALMGVMVPPGQHTIKFEYSRKNIYISFFLMFLSWMVAISFLPRYAKKR